MQGLGVGLCLSRLRMEHFGGSVQIQEHDGRGDTDNQYQMPFPEELEPGCRASILLHKDKDFPEQLYTA